MESSPRWKDQGHRKNKTKELVTLFKEHNVIRVKHVYKIKHIVDEKIERYEERLVAKGYSRRKDFTMIK